MRGRLREWARRAREAQGVIAFFDYAWAILQWIGGFVSKSIWLPLTGVMIALIAVVLHLFRSSKTASVDGINVSSPKKQTDEIRSQYISPEPNYDEWATIQELTLWHAACLWARTEPSDLPHAGAQRHLDHLRRAIVLGRLKPLPEANSPMLGMAIAMAMRSANTDDIDTNIIVSRKELARYALHRKEKPRFLFKRRWWSLWTHATPRQSF
jgi:hypothetical protein